MFRNVYGGISYGLNDDDDNNSGAFLSLEVAAETDLGKTNIDRCRSADDLLHSYIMRGYLRCRWKHATGTGPAGS